MSKELKASVSDQPIFEVSSEAFWLTNGKVIALSTPLRLPRALSGGGHELHFTGEKPEAQRAV